MKKTMEKIKRMTNKVGNYVWERKGKIIMLVINVGIAIHYVIRNSEHLGEEHADADVVDFNEIQIIDMPIDEDYEVLNDEKTANVSRHIRMLPKGMKASLEKIETAHDFGFELSEGQTWVSDYTKKIS